MSEENLAANWRTQRGAIIELPSGNRARIVRSLDLNEALKNGSIPNPLRGVLSKMLDQGNEKVSAKEFAADPEVILQMNALMNKTVCESMVNPRCQMPPEGENPATWQPDDPNTISIVDLSDEDKIFIYGVAQGGATDLESFRKQQEKFMESLADEREVPQKAKRNSRGKRPVGGVLS